MALVKFGGQGVGHFDVTVTTPPGKDGGKAKVQSHELVFLPGVNNVPDDAWAELVKQATPALPALHHYFKKKLLEELKGRKAEEFGKLPVEDALEMVADTNVEGLLKQFRDSDGVKPEVLEAIEAKIKKLQPEA